MLYAEDVRAPNYVHDRLLLPSAPEKQKVFLDQHLSLHLLPYVVSTLLKLSCAKNSKIYCQRDVFPTTHQHYSQQQGETPN